jgi:hypothetical protein
MVSTATEIVASLTRSAEVLDRVQTKALSQELIQTLAAGNAPDIGKAQGWRSAGKPRPAGREGLEP